MLLQIFFKEKKKIDSQVPGISTVYDETDVIGILFHNLGNLVSI